MQLLDFSAMKEKMSNFSKISIYYVKQTCLTEGNDARLNVNVKNSHVQATNVRNNSKLHFRENRSVQCTHTKKEKNKYVIIYIVDELFAH